MKKPLKDERSRSLRYALFETSLGGCGIAWSPEGIVSVQLPEMTKTKTETRLREKTGAEPALPPAWVARVMKEIQNLLAGRKSDLSGTRIDWQGVPSFHQKVYRALLKIPAGRVSTYGELAREAGSPMAARAVGQAMARNPLPLLVPCHRVVGSGKATGGFSAYGGVKTKARLLSIEGVRLDSGTARES